MAKNYSYRMDHDTGFAPHVEKGFCFLSGCKKTNVEKWATKGSWVIGIGGNHTKQPNKLIYVMEVDENISYENFIKHHETNSKYLTIDKKGNNVLISKHFVYFGDKAIPLPENLSNILITTQGCKKVSDDDIKKLEKYLNNKKTWGEIGKPNNPKPFKVKSNKCSC